jgi:LysM repeat protein
MADYKVKKGDTLSQIAKARGTTVKEIQAANPQITNVNLIKPGQVFNIPTTTKSNADKITDDALAGLKKFETALDTSEAKLDAWKKSIESGQGLFGENVEKDAKAPPPAPLTPPERSLASDTFRSTLGLLFGATEAAKPYVTQLYGLVSNFYKTGSSVEEALNLALYQAENEKAIPEFTKRFAGLFSIRDMKQKGMAVTVPTIAEFFAAEAKMGEILTNAGLGSLATEDFLGGVIGQNKSVLEVGNLISDVFTSIDYAPTELKTTLQTFFPGVDRTAIAKAILTGKEGAQELSQKVKGISVLSAAQQQGVAMDLPTATNIAKQGYDYQQSLTGFGQVKRLERIDTIAQFGGGNFTATQAQNAVFGKSIKEQMTIEELAKQEEARFQGSSGRFASKDRAAGQI